MPTRARQHPQAAVPAATRPCRLSKHSRRPTTAVSATPISVPPAPFLLADTGFPPLSVLHPPLVDGLELFLHLHMYRAATTTAPGQLWGRLLGAWAASELSHRGAEARAMHQTHPAQTSHLLSRKHVVLWLLTARANQVEPLSNLPGLRSTHTHTQHRVAVRVSTSAQLCSLASIWPDDPARPHSVPRVETLQTLASHPTPSCPSPPPAALGSTLKFPSRRPSPAAHMQPTRLLAKTRRTPAIHCAVHALHPAQPPCRATSDAHKGMLPIPTWSTTQFIARTVSSMGVSGSGRWQNRTSLRHTRNAQQQVASSMRTHRRHVPACLRQHEPHVLPPHGVSRTLLFGWTLLNALASGRSAHSHIVQLQALQAVACALNDVLPGQPLVVGPVPSPEHLGGDDNVLTLPPQLLQEAADTGW